MINILYLLKTLNTDKLSELVANIDAPPLDYNLAIWDSIDAGEIEIDEENDHIRILKEAKPSSDPELKDKILRVIQYYARSETNITRGRLNGYIKDLASQTGYRWDQYLVAVQHLIDEGTVVQHVIDVPAVTKEKVSKTGKRKVKVVRPAHKFAFLGLAENEDKNEEWNAKAVNKWIADMEQHMVR